MLGDRNLLVKLSIYTMECYTLIINNELVFVVVFYFLFKLVGLNKMNLLLYSFVTQKSDGISLG